MVDSEQEGQEEKEVALDHAATSATPTKLFSKIKIPIYLTPIHRQAVPLRRAIGTIPWYTPIRCTPVRYTPVKCTFTHTYEVHAYEVYLYEMHKVGSEWKQSFA